MNFDNISKVANAAVNKQNSENKNRRLMDDILNNVFPSEKDALLEIANNCKINKFDLDLSNIKDEARFYIAFDLDTNYKDPIGYNCFRTNAFCYILGEHEIIRKCKYKTVGIYSDSRNAHGLISNLYEIPEITIPYPTEEFNRDLMIKAVDRSTRNIENINFGDKYTSITDGIFSQFLANYDVISSYQQNYYGYDDHQGLISVFYFYTKGSKDGEQLLIKNEIHNKTENAEFEISLRQSYRNYVLAGIKKLNFENGLEELLCKLFKENPFYVDFSDLSLRFIVYTPMKEVECTYKEPIITINFNEPSLEVTAGNISQDIGEITSDVAVDVEMSELYWKHFNDSKYGKLDIYENSGHGVRIYFAKIFEGEDVSFCNDILNLLESKLQDAGLIVLDKEVDYDASEYADYKFRVKNPIKDRINS